MKLKNTNNPKYSLSNLFHKTCMQKDIEQLQHKRFAMFISEWKTFSKINNIYICKKEN